DSSPDFGTAQQTHASVEYLRTHAGLGQDRSAKQYRIQLHVTTNAPHSAAAYCVDSPPLGGQCWLMQLLSVDLRLRWLLLFLAWSGDFSALHGQPFWPQFRGPNGQGVADSAHPPTTFSPSENAIWSVEI